MLRGKDYQDKSEVKAFPQVWSVRGIDVRKPRGRYCTDKQRQNECTGFLSKYLYSSL